MRWKLLSTTRFPWKRAGEAHARFGTDALIAALASCRQLTALGDAAYFDAMRARHSHLKRYLPAFLKLPFEPEPGMDALVKAIEVATRLLDGDIAKLPHDVDASFTSSRWQAQIRKDGTLNQPLWEVALALAVRDALRSGDLYLPGSKNHVSFWDLAYSPERWKEEKEAAYRQLRVSEESAGGVAARKHDHHAEDRVLAKAGHPSSRRPT